MQKKKLSQDIATTTTTSNEDYWNKIRNLPVVKKQPTAEQIARVTKTNKLVTTNWAKHYAGERRIRNKLITLEYSLKEPNLKRLKKTIQEEELTTIISLQIKDLLDYFGFKNSMNAEQIIDTAEFILEDFDGFSIRALQHCFNMVKQSKPPFNKELYNTINGNKIMKFLQDYDKYVDDKLFSKANFKAEIDIIRAQERQITTAGKLGGIADKFAKIKKNLKK